MRAHDLAEQLLTYGHTVAWVCDATTLPRPTVHRIAHRAGMTWHSASDTMRRPGPKQTKAVRDLIAGLTDELDQVTDPKERRILRRQLAQWVGRLERELYPSTTDPLRTATKRRRRPAKKANRT